MRDSLQKVTTALTGATTVNSSSIKFGHDNTATAVGGPVWYGHEVEINYPATPSGTSPSAKAMVQDSLDDSTFVDCALVHNTETAGSYTFPQNRGKRFFPRPGAKSFRVSWTLNNADNNYGSVVVALTSSDRRTQGI